MRYGGHIRSDGPGINNHKGGYRQGNQERKNPHALLFLLIGLFREIESESSQGRKADHEENGTDPS